MKKLLVLFISLWIPIIGAQAQSLTIVSPSIHNGTWTGGTITGGTLTGDGTSTVTGASNIINAPSINNSTITGGTATGMTVIGGTVTTTDLSAANVLPSGGTIKRTLSNKFNEILSVTDFGAIMSGTSHTLASLGYTTLAAAQVYYPAATSLSQEADYLAFYEAQLYAQGFVGTTEVIVPSGSLIYLGVGQTIYTVSSTGWVFHDNVVLVTGQIEGVDDTLSNNVMSLTKASSYSGNESVEFTSASYFATPVGTPGYQKNGKYIRLFAFDPSTYTTGLYADSGVNTYDVVGYESQVAIDASNQYGRVFGYHSAATINSGGDGYAVAGEFEVYNNGTYQPYVGKANMKIGLHVDAMGNADSSAGISVSGNMHWRQGIVFDRAAIRTDGWAWTMRDRPLITDTSERPVIAGLDYNGGLSAQTVSVAGHVFNTGASPSIQSGCGTGATLTSNSSDHRGSVVIGSGAPTTCVIAWQYQYPANPIAIVGTNVSNLTVGAQATTTTLTISLSAGAAAGSVVTWFSEG